MATFTITVQDQGVSDALKALSARLRDMTAVLDTIGTGIIERTKRRFDTSTGPDGTPWLPNSAATLMMLGEYLVGHRKKDGARSYAYSKQGGLLNGKGLERMANKKPLIGESQDLRRQFFSLVVGSTLTVNSSPVYAAIQQFGGQAGRGHKVTIPARPFLPIRLDGTLYPDEQAEIIKVINDYLMEGL